MQIVSYIFLSVFFMNTLFFLQADSAEELDFELGKMHPIEIDLVEHGTVKSVEVEIVPIEGETSFIKIEGGKKLLNQVNFYIHKGVLVITEEGLCPPFDGFVSRYHPHYKKLTGGNGTGGDYRLTVQRTIVNGVQLCKNGEEFKPASITIYLKAPSTYWEYIKIKESLEKLESTVKFNERVKKEMQFDFMKGIFDNNIKKALAEMDTYNSILKERAAEFEWMHQRIEEALNAYKLSRLKQEL